jgi:glycosyltransferase involved in cell wall biosynthesis
VIDRTPSAPHDPAVSVVIPTIGRPAQLTQLLRAILAEDGPPIEILVAHNGPRAEATRVAAAEAAAGDHRVRVLAAPRAGTSRARNRGLSEARADIVAFLDDDVVVRPGWLIAIANAFAAAPGVACVTGLIEPAELATPEQGWLEEYGGYGKGSNRRVFDLAAHRPPDPLFPYTAGAFGSGANMAFRASALRAIGGFDPALGGGTPARGGEDLAAFAAIVAKGHSLVYEPAAAVVHRHHRSRARLQRQVLAYGMGLSAFLTKHVADDGARLIDVARRVPRGLLLLLAPSSPKNMRKSPSYPRVLTLLELAGFAAGPFAYAAGRRRPRLGSVRWESGRG